ncbi:DUF3316 domain-containing protein [Vibrio ziniensis]|uniref:DUF3316 domain-containing protein n=1 Tax=Vibrio ziniensis TaxID=2711221 RepID=A0A6G7CP95_9VIBR|nr:DUF3316 domain-containing protein [Vibrio ziniensis]QIH43910.1 DUF3316 domain-containing protein [Vibrio ziniensis]
MNKLITVAAGLLLTSSAFASNVTISQSSSLKTGMYESKSEAYAAGFDLSDSIAGMDKSQLKNNLSLWAYNTVSDITIENSDVVIQETATSRGNIGYRAIVNLHYTFKTRESKD